MRFAILVALEARRRILSCDGVEGVELVGPIMP
jgi:hypothetical protein